MVTQKKNTMFILVMTLAATLVMASTTFSATPEPTALQPKTEVTAPLNTPETKEAKAPPASDQKTSDKQEKSDKKNGPRAGMLLTFFAIITGHQGTTR